jgi:hypothetical protein
MKVESSELEEAVTRSQPMFLLAAGSDSKLPTHNSQPS